MKVGLEVDVEENWGLLQLGGVTRYVMEDSCGYVCLHRYIYISISLDFVHICCLDYLLIGGKLIL